MKRATATIETIESNLQLRVQPVRFIKNMVQVKTITLNNTASFESMIQKKMQTQIKKLLVLALLGFAAFAAFAQSYQPNISILNLRLSDGAPFKVFIDGQQAGGSGTVAKFNSTQGQHYLQVYRIGKSWGYETMDNAFRGNVVLTGNAEAFATVYPDMQKIKFDNIIALNTTPQFGHPKPIICYYPQRPNLHEVTQTSYTQCNETPVVPPAPATPQPMCMSEFNQLKQTIDHAGFESTRLSIFKQALPYNYFTSAQVRDLMDMFWFESTKLEMAKLAYPKTVDQNNYYIVNNGFSFNSSVNELGEYVAMR